jgi:hypothetical protein
VTTHLLDALINRRRIDWRAVPHPHYCTED